MPQASFQHGAFAIILNEKNEVLLLHRTDKDLWNLPGGKVEAGEAPWEACVREVKEETGLDVVVDRCVGLYYKREQDEVVFQFVCTITGGELTKTDEARDHQYVSLERMPINTNPKHRHRIELFLQYPNAVQMDEHSDYMSSDELFAKL